MKLSLLPAPDRGLRRRRAQAPGSPVRIIGIDNFAWKTQSALWHRGVRPRTTPDHRPAARPRARNGGGVAGGPSRNRRRVQGSRCRVWPGCIKGCSTGDPGCRPLASDGERRCRIHGVSASVDASNTTGARLHRHCPGPADLCRAHPIWRFPAPASTVQVPRLESPWYVWRPRPDSNPHPPD